jgi:Rod binding domain-containing protein
MSGLPAPVGAATDAFARRSAPMLPKGADEAAARKAGRDFEAFFVTQMLEHMFKGIPTDGFFGGGQAEGIYRSLLLQNYGQAISERGGIGIADMVTREMLKHQEVK